MRIFILSLESWGKINMSKVKSEKFSRAFGAQKYLLPNFNFNDVGGASQNWCRTKASHLSQEVTARMYVPYQCFSFKGQNCKMKTKH